MACPSRNQVQNFRPLTLPASIDRRHRPAFCEQVDGLREATHVAARALDPFNVLAELSLEDELR